MVMKRSICLVYIKCSDDESANVLKSSIELLKTLTSSQTVEVLSSSQHPPLGCAIQTISAKCEVHLMLKVSAFKYLGLNVVLCTGSSRLRGELVMWLLTSWLVAQLV